HDAIESAGLWEELNTEWIALDCELMPWSAKAMELVREQYAAVGAAATASLSRAVGVLQAAKVRDVKIDELLAKYDSRKKMIDLYKKAYRHYC
ncbi:polynucleotide kinase-phosphatase, partial [Acinetobacter baumannii]